MPDSETTGCCTTDSPSPRPLFLGRLLRVLAGVASLGLVPILGAATLGGWGVAGLAFLGISFVISGLSGNAGCELTAIPNLVLPAARRIHCFCPLWTPLDKIEYRARKQRDGVTIPR